MTYGYGLNAQKYGLTTGLEGVSTRSSEISAAFVRRFVFKRWSPFLLAGASALVFDPNNVPAANTQTRVAFLYGGGTDFDLGRRIYMPAEYRGFVYSSPTFNLPELAGTSRLSHNVEPSIGFGYRF